MKRFKDLASLKVNFSDMYSFELHFLKVHNKIQYRVEKPKIMRKIIKMQKRNVGIKLFDFLFEFLKLTDARCDVLLKNFLFLFQK